MVYQFNETDEKKEESNNYYTYKRKLRISITGFILYLLLSTTISFKVLNLILEQFVNITILNEKNEPSILSKFIMAFIIAIILFIF
jgi:hypothetical protein